MSSIANESYVVTLYNGYKDFISSIVNESNVATLYNGYNYFTTFQGGHKPCGV